jgi:exopolysaccharide biosynthesis polyprenyl glycosylphosphotransferase
VSLHAIAPDLAGVADANAPLGALEPARPQRKPRHYSLSWIAALLASDLVMFAFSAAAGIALVHATHLPKLSKFGPIPAIASAAVIVAFQILMFERLGLYRRSLALSIRDELYYTTAALCIGATPLLVFFTLMPQLSSSRLIILASLALSIISVGGGRAAVHKVRTITERRRRSRIAIVGRREQTSAIADALNVDDTDLVCIDVDDLDRTVAGFAFSRDADFDEVPWFAQARAFGCDTLLLTQTLPPRLLPALLKVATRQHIKVAFAPPRFRVHAYAVALEVAGEQALIVPAQLRACTLHAQVLKRLCDTAFASVALLIASPIMLLCALAIAIESRGPILYRQERVGLDGKVFEILKFRSMRADAESASGPVWTAAGDARTTRLGRLLRRASLDELPQIFNVLRGDMSIVGPRPERPVFVQSFREAIPRYDERHLVRPGITGWSQVNMRRVLHPTQAPHKLSYDLFYIEQWSLFLDIYIVTKTAVEFLFHRAA